MHPLTHLSTVHPSTHPSIIRPSFHHLSIIHPSTHQSFHHPSISPSIIHLSSSIHPPIHPSSTHQSFHHPSISPSIIHLSVNPSIIIHLSIHPSILPSAHPSIPPFVHLSSSIHSLIHSSIRHVFMALPLGWCGPWPYSPALCEDSVSLREPLQEWEHHAGHAVLSLNIYFTPSPGMMIISMSPSCHTGEVLMVDQRPLGWLEPRYSTAMSSQFLDSRDPRREQAPHSCSRRSLVHSPGS